MYSMTGFGRGEASNGQVGVVVEAKSVNNRFRDVQLRLPREYQVLETRVSNVVRDSIARGRVELFIRRTSVEGDTRITPDLALAEQFYRAAQEVAARLQRPEPEVSLTWVLSQPGVLNAREAEPDVLREWDLVETALEAALSEMQEMRGAEGQALQQDLTRHLTQLQRLRSEVEAAAEGVAERLRARLEERMNRLMGERLDPVRAAQEAALLADKADISEELARLASHCEQFASTLTAAEPVGRKLDFLLQEMNREVNTIGSKSAEHPISSRVVEMKSVLERMREQAANVE